MPPALAHKFPRRWLPLLVPTAFALVIAVYILATGARSGDSETTRRTATPGHRPAVTTDAPTPEPVSFVPPSPLPDSPPPVDIALTTLDGETFRLDDLSGQVVLLNFWAAWCLPCRDEMPALQQFQNQHEADGVRVIAVTDPAAGQTEADILAFVAEYGLTFTVALSSDPALYEQWGVDVIPTTFIIDRDGVVRGWHVGEMSPGDLAAAFAALEDG